MIGINKPVKLYVDTPENLDICAITTTKVSVIVNVHKMNDLRNSRLDKPISIPEESPFVQAGKYLCIKSLAKNMKDMELYYINGTAEALIEETLKTLPTQQHYIVSLIVEYINKNYDEIKDDVVLVTGVPPGAQLL